MNTYLQTGASLHSILSGFVANGPFTGLTVGIVKDQQVIFTGEYGAANVSTGEPVAHSTLFHLASVSKTLVVTAVMQLAERGLVQLDSPVTAYLPYFKMEDERYPLITVRQLLNHTSGMPDEEDYAWDRPEYDEQSLERYVLSISRHKLLSEPGACFAYSNIAYEILGDLIAKVSGLSFEQYMKEHILDPAGMTASSFLKQEVEANIAAPHILTTSDGYGAQVSKVFPYNRAHAPSSTLYSSIHDMCRYMLMHLNQGKAEDSYNALQPDSYDAMWSPSMATGWGHEHEHVGLGWFLGEYKGSRMLSHSGWDTGFLSELMLFPDDNTGICVMTNCDHVWPGSVTLPLRDHLLGAELHRIKQSMAHHIASIAVTGGMEQALEEYHRISREEQDAYYDADFEFLRITDSISWYGHKEDALAIITCAAAIFPGSEAISRKLKLLRTEEETTK
ncbi:serine hydrolase domain-containing protein [Paenibacillus sp. MMS20-IR301]|uniref:serine hydrolase domain-containing protein n=1 Tax=Paenibacillus sp. MMS20-IR301 TaxID=2895946 RepID=UPI0028ED6200|nr:serine hydrolase domain-containing protein [Paenibacillus sp. MMS20-IR301]WNS45285.1 serine hydrolase domain-containing protein [Paenibacillus sp. MMS20-IR301]